MKPILRLTWRYLSYHRLRTAILVVCLALTFILPFYLQVLIHTYRTSLTSRAIATPLVLGPRGNPFELVLRTLYFTSTAKGDAPITLADQEQIASHDRATVIPMHLGYTAERFPVVGTSLDYFEHRSLIPSSGTLPLILGDAVIGHDVAKELALTPGQTLLTDQTSLYNIAAELPLKLKITGILPQTRTPDDGAIFVDVKTAWVIAGLGHGHVDLEQPENQSKLLGRTSEGALIGSAAVAPYREITEENLSSFHFHGESSSLPLSSLIVVPDDTKSSTILKGHYQLSKTLQIIPPTDVVDELLAIVFKVKRFFDLSFGLVLIMTLLFLLLVMILTWKLREQERETLKRIGCGPRTLLGLQLTELGILLTLGLALAAVLAWLLITLTDKLQLMPL